MSLLSDSEFKSAAVPSPDLLRKLAALAVYGNESLYTVFTVMAERGGLTERGREAREKQQERYAALARMMMATQERMAEFQRELDRIERKSYEALIEAEEKRTKARRELDEMRKRAFEIEVPDGRRVKVFRDGDQVREESGTIVSPDIIKADDIPKSCPEWEPWEQARTTAESAEAAYGQAASDYSRVQEAKEVAAEGTMTDDQIDELKSEIEPVRHRLDDARPATKREAMPPDQSVSAPGPV